MGTHRQIAGAMFPVAAPLSTVPDFFAGKKWCLIRSRKALWIVENDIEKRRKYEC